MGSRISIKGSVRPERVFFNEPIMGENGQKWLGKQSKGSKLYWKSSELSQNVPKFPTQTHRCSNGLVSQLSDLRGRISSFWKHISCFGMWTSVLNSPTHFFPFSIVWYSWRKFFVNFYSKHSALYIVLTTTILPHVDNKRGFVVYNPRDSWALSSLLIT